jgi:hypothetical protein
MTHDISKFVFCTVFLVMDHISVSPIVLVPLLKPPIA